MAADPPLGAGAVLVGGTSSRMGRDKATIRVGEATMAERVAAALAGAGLSPVVTVGGPGGEVSDHPGGEGPLAGVLGALAWSPAPVLVVAPCDLVAPEPRAFAALVGALAAHPEAAAAVPALDRPLPIALRAGARAALARCFADGERSLRRALAGVVCVEVDLDDAALADADRPEDLPPGTR